MNTIHSEENRLFWSNSGAASSVSQGSFYAFIFSRPQFAYLVVTILGATLCFSPFVVSQNVHWTSSRDAIVEATPLFHSLSTSRPFRDSSVAAITTSLAPLIDVLLDFLSVILTSASKSTTRTVDSKASLPHTSSDFSNGKNSQSKNGTFQAADHAAADDIVEANEQIFLDSASSFSKTERIIIGVGAISLPLVSVLLPFDSLSAMRIVLIYICMNFAQNVLIMAGILLYLARRNPKFWTIRDVFIQLIFFVVGQVAAPFEYSRKNLERNNWNSASIVSYAFTLIAAVLFLRTAIRWFYTKYFYVLAHPYYRKLLLRHYSGRFGEQHFRAGKEMRRFQVLPIFEDGSPLRNGANDANRASSMTPSASNIYIQRNTRVGRRRGSQEVKRRSGFSCISLMKLLGIPSSNNLGLDYKVADVDRGSYDAVMSDMRRKRASGQNFAPLLYVAAVVFSVAVLSYNAFQYDTMLQMDTTGLVLSNALAMSFMAAMLFTSLRLARAEINYLMGQLESKRSFVRYISHELRTPLSVVGFGLDFLKEDINDQIKRNVKENHVNRQKDEVYDDVFFTAKANDVREQVMVMQDSCTMAVGILNSLLRYDNLTSGEKLHMSVAPLVIADIIEDSIKSVKLAATKKGVSMDLVSLSSCVNEPERVLVNADRAAMFQAMHTLMRRALYVSQSGGLVTITLRLVHPEEEDFRNDRRTSLFLRRKPRRFSLPFGGNDESGSGWMSNSSRSSSPSWRSPRHSELDHGSSNHLHHNMRALYDNALHAVSEKLRGTFAAPTMVAIDVKDEGVGFDKTQFRRVLLRTFHFDPGDLRGGGEDSGLGMLMCKSIVRSHGGKLWMRSEGIGRGTSFTIYLPISGYKGAEPRSPETHDFCLECDGSSTAGSLPCGDIRAKANEEIQGSFEGTHDKIVEIKGATVMTFDPASIEEDCVKDSCAMGTTHDANKCSDIQASNANSSQPARVRICEATNADRSATSGGIDSRKQLRVLVVDDSALVRRMICRLMSSQFHAVTEEAEDGSQALEIMKKKKEEAEISQPVHTHHTGSIRLVNDEFPVVRRVSYISQSIPSKRIQDFIAKTTSILQAHENSFGRGALPRKVPSKAASDNQGDSVFASSGLVKSIRHGAVSGCQEDSHRVAVRKEATEIPSHRASCDAVLASVEPWGFDLILCDNVMPVMDGPTAVSHIRALGYTGPIFGVTGNVLQSDVNYFMSCGATLVLPKPLSVEELRHGITVHCRKRHRKPTAGPKVLSHAQAAAHELLLSPPEMSPPPLSEEPPSSRPEYQTEASHWHLQAVRSFISVVSEKTCTSKVFVSDGVATVDDLPGYSTADRTINNADLPQHSTSSWPMAAFADGEEKLSSKTDAHMVLFGIRDD